MRCPLRVGQPAEISQCRSGGAGDELVVPLGLGADNLGEMEDRNQTLGLAVFVGDDVVTLLPVGGTFVPVCPMAAIERLLERLELSEQLVQEGATVRDDWLLQMRVELL